MRRRPRAFDKQKGLSLKSTGRVEKSGDLMPRISVVMLAALVLPAAAAGSAKSVNLSLVAYSTPKDAFAKIIPAFQKTSAGQGVTFSQSYGASSEQARAVVAGLPADVVDLSLAPDVGLLVQKHLVDPSWDKNK